MSTTARMVVLLNGFSTLHSSFPHVDRDFNYRTSSLYSQEPFSPQQQTVASRSLPQAQEVHYRGALEDLGLGCRQAIRHLAGLKVRAVEVEDRRGHEGRLRCWDVAGAIGLVPRRLSYEVDLASQGQ